MVTKKREIKKLYFEQAFCEECGVEMEMVPDAVLACYPPKYVIECPKCKKREAVDDTFPRVMFGKDTFEE